MWEGVIFINPLNLGNPTFVLKLFHHNPRVNSCKLHQIQTFSVID